MLSEENILSQGSRIEMADNEKMNSRQKVIYNKIVSGRRGKIVGPLRVALHSPELANRWHLLGEFLRFETTLASSISELAIIVTARYWNSQVEWFIHSAIAETAGVPPEVIEAIRTRVSPKFDKEEDYLVYEFAKKSLEFGQVDAAIYTELKKLIGKVSIVELTGLIGYYSMVAMTLNIHSVPLPNEKMGSLLDLPTGNELIPLSALPCGQFSS
ncbi:MAG: carboxymuconolactone decarboxylase [Alphaproteobacteria bacterium]|nr:MAG: carboxymuconolactone decarboxylase [Alphaproteobacteria bacterium]